MPVLGKHNIYSSLAAIAVCNAIGICIEDIGRKFMDFKLPPMRMGKQICSDIIIINDEYNSSPSSMSVALDELSQLPATGRRIFICGDMLELGKDAKRLHEEMGKKVAGSNIDFLWTVGTFSRFVAEEAVTNGMPRENILSYDTVEDVCSFVPSQLKEKDIVLIKGSREMRLERVSQQIEKCFSQK